jgi:hypothetical protein
MVPELDYRVDFLDALGKPVVREQIRGHCRDPNSIVYDVDYAMPDGTHSALLLSPVGLTDRGYLKRLLGAEVITHLCSLSMSVADTLGWYEHQSSLGNPRFHVGKLERVKSEAA